MYKLREARLRDLYNMDATGANYGVSKTNSHGNLVADHSFESFKSKEIRDSESPTRYIFLIFNITIYNFILLFVAFITLTF